MKNAKFKEVLTPRDQQVQSQHQSISVSLNFAFSFWPCDKVDSKARSSIRHKKGYFMIITDEKVFKFLYAFIFEIYKVIIDTV